MNIDDFDFHDSQILSVTENTQDHYLDFLLDFPTNWQDNIFEKRILRFTEVIFYNINEIPFFGQPTILEIVNFGQVIKSWGQKEIIWRLQDGKLKFKPMQETEL